MPMGRLCMIKGAGSKVKGSEREVDEALADEDKTEGRCPRIPVDPGRPTKREIEEHNATHWPFRSWCPHCVRGRACSSPHPRPGGGVEKDALTETGVATISLDYCFVSADEEEEASAAGERPVLVMVDNKTEAIHAAAVEKKGVVPWVVK